jgi:uncharacterized protein (TIGR02246 family)
MPDDLQAITHQRREWIAAVNARDVDRYVDLLAEDVVWLPPGQPALRGRSAFAAWVRPFFERFSYEFDLVGPTVRLAGDWAVERGGFTTRMGPLEGGQRGHHTGNYMILWRRDSDGRWRIERYIDETQAPEAA